VEGAGPGVELRALAVLDDEEAAAVDGQVEGTRGGLEGTWLNWVATSATVTPWPICMAPEAPPERLWLKTLAK
jgi:hypothetical protein